MSPATGTSRSPSVLVVDDDPGIRELVHAMLSIEGFEVRLAASGDAALDVLADGAVDLVITDLLMPGRSGFEAISELRAHDRALPILAISGGGRIGVQECLHTARCVGATATLAKPFGQRELLAQVFGLLG